MRARVSDLLDQGAATRLTLVSAQAGFGKTTAIVNWVHQRSSPGLVAWVSLDPGDHRPATFWPYVVDGPDGPLRRESTHPRHSGPDDHGLEPRRRPYCRNGFLNRLKPPGQRRPASIERDVA